MVENLKRLVGTLSLVLRRFSPEGLEMHNTSVDAFFSNNKGFLAFSLSSYVVGMDVERPLGGIGRRYNMDFLRILRGEGGRPRVCGGLILIEALVKGVDVGGNAPWLWLCMGEVRGQA